MDERHHPDDEIAWFWHLGADAKLAMVMTNIAGDGGKTADPREERVKVLKPSRGEGRDVSVPAIRQMLHLHLAQLARGLRMGESIVGE